MTWIIGEGIQNYKITLATVKYKVSSVIILSVFLTQDTATPLRARYILYSPWCPEMLHRFCIISPT